MSKPIVQLQADMGSGFEDVYVNTVSEEVYEIENLNTFDPRTLNIPSGKTVRIIMQANTQGNPFPDMVAGELTNVSVGDYMFHLSVKRGSSNLNLLGPISAETFYFHDSWSGWRQGISAIGEVLQLQNLATVTNWNAVDTIFNQMGDGGVTVARSSSGSANNPPGATNYNIGLFMRWNSGNGCIFGSMNGRSNTFAYRGFVSGAWHEWRFVPTTTTMQAPINEETGEEMDVYQAHDYNLNRIKKLENDLTLYKDFIAHKFGEEFETFKATK